MSKASRAHLTWEEFVKRILKNHASNLLIIADPAQPQRKLIDAPWMKNAMHGKSGSWDEHLERYTSVWHFVLTANLLVNPASADPKNLSKKLSDYLERVRRVVEHLDAARSELGPQWRSELKTFTEKVESGDIELTGHFEGVALLRKYFDPRNLSLRGRAVRRPEGATAGWVIKELDRIVPISAKSRTSTITQALKSCGIERSLQSVARILSVAREKKRGTGIPAGRSR